MCVPNFYAMCVRERFRELSALYMVPNMLTGRVGEVVADFAEKKLLVRSSSLLIYYIHQVLSASDAYHISHSLIAILLSKA